MGFKIKASDGATLEIQDGEYYFNTKARGRRMMANSLSNDARRVYACLELATLGFKQELAVTMDAGETRALTPSDIRQQTGLLKQCVTRGLVELEDAGLALRKAPDGGALRKGQVLIYSWAVPREPKEENSKRARLLFPDWFPESWEPLKPFISRYKYSITADEVSARDYLEEGAEVARAYQHAEMVTARFLERICARAKTERPSLLMKERKDRKAAAAVKLPTAAAAPPPAPAPVSDVDLVAREFKTHAEMAEAIVAEARAVDPSLTGPEIVEVGNRKLQRAGPTVRNGPALLRKYIGEEIRRGAHLEVREELRALREQDDRERAYRAALLAESEGASP